MNFPYHTDPAGHSNVVLQMMMSFGCLMLKCVLISLVFYTLHCPLLHCQLQCGTMSPGSFSRTSVYILKHWRGKQFSPIVLSDEITHKIIANNWFYNMQDNNPANKSSFLKYNIRFCLQFGYLWYLVLYGQYFVNYFWLKPWKNNIFKML